MELFIYFGKKNSISLCIRFLLIQTSVYTSSIKYAVKMTLHLEKTNIFYNCFFYINNFSNSTTFISNQQVLTKVVITSLYLQIVYDFYLP